MKSEQPRSKKKNDKPEKSTAPKKKAYTSPKVDSAKKIQGFYLS